MANPISGRAVQGGKVFLVRVAVGWEVRLSMRLPTNASGRMPGGGTGACAGTGSEAGAENSEGGLEMFVGLGSDAVAIASPGR